MLLHAVATVFHRQTLLHKFVSLDRLLVCNGYCDWASCPLHQISRENRPNSDVVFYEVVFYYVISSGVEQISVQYNEFESDDRILDVL